MKPEHDERHPLIGPTADLIHIVVLEKDSAICIDYRGKCHWRRSDGSGGSSLIAVSIMRGGKCLKALK